MATQLRDLPRDPLADLAHASGPPAARATLRAQPEDFCVEERLRFEPEGEGEHAYLKIEKRGRNTHDVRRALAAFAGVRESEVGFAGLKDRHAVTSQWFSVALAGRQAPDWRAFESDTVKVLASARHRRKLKAGQLGENRFRIVLRSFEGDRDDLAARLAAVAANGVPNYFGAQRFGRAGGNLDAAARMLAGETRVRDRKLRGLFLSAARAFIFNRVLSSRVGAGTWNRALPGDVLMFDDSRSRFALAPDDSQDDPRIEALELHPTGPLWGRGAPGSSGETDAMEREVAESCPELAKGLESAGVDADRRALRLAPRDFAWDLGRADEIVISFALRPGAYATAVLRELAAV